MNRERTLVAALALALLLPLLATAPRLTAGLSPREPGPRTAQIEGLRSRPDIPVDNLHGNAPAPTQAELAAEAVCDKEIDRSSRIYNVRFVAAKNNGLCINTDLDGYQTPTKSYVVQGAQGWAYTHYDVSRPSKPAIVRRHGWGGAGGPYTRTTSIKAFKQGKRYYVAMGLERRSSDAYCGVAIVEVTNPARPVKRSQFVGGAWCDTHNVFVEKDKHGDGRYVYATANLVDDLRVLDISGEHGGTVRAPREIGRYRAPTAGPHNYVHDMVVVDHGGKVGRRLYVSYWRSGLVILDADDVTPGVNPRPLVGPNVIDPPGFRMHYAVPNKAGTRVFVQDEFLRGPGDEPIQMWDISNIPARRPRYADGLKPNVGVRGERLQAHNFIVSGNAIYVGWYKGGLQGWLFTDRGFGKRWRYHQAQTERADGLWDGAWGVLRMEIGGAVYFFQGDMGYGLLVDRVP